MTPSPTSRLAASEEYVFHHAFVREAAYASLTDDDRRAGHLLAARWLERAGERDPIAMIEHFEAGGAGRAGLSWYVAAAEAVVYPTTGGLVPIAERGLRFAEGAEERGPLLAWLSYGLSLSGRLHDARGASIEALALTRPATSEWLTALSSLLVVGQSLPDSSLAPPYLSRLATLADDPEPSYAAGVCLWSAYIFARSVGEVRLADAAAAMLERVADRAGDEAPLVEMWRQALRSFRGRFEPSWFPSALASARRAIAIAQTAGYGDGVEVARQHAMRLAPLLGDLETLRAELQAGFTNPLFAEYVPAYATLLSAIEGDLVAAESSFRDATTRGSRKTEIGVRPFLALFYAEAGRLEEAAALVDEIPPAAEGLLGQHADSLHGACPRRSRSRRRPGCARAVRRGRSSRGAMGQLPDHSPASRTHSGRGAHAARRRRRREANLRCAPRAIHAFASQMDEPHAYQLPLPWISLGADSEGRAAVAGRGVSDSWRSSRGTRHDGSFSPASSSEMAVSERVEKHFTHGSSARMAEIEAADHHDRVREHEQRRLAVEFPTDRRTSSP